MSTASQVESFCESCGTRYAFQPRRTAKRHLVKVGRLVGILPDEPDVDDSALVVSKDPFHGAFHFCLECRRFTCPTCWDAPAGFCRSCASVLSGQDGPSEPEYVLDPDTQALLRAAFDDLARLGSEGSWLELEAPPAARPEATTAAPAELGEPPADDLTHIIEAGVAAMEARHLQAAREAAAAAEREQARLEEERREQAEAERVAAEQAEAQRLAWEEYERERQQYEADLAAWEAAEALRVAAERDEAERLVAEQAERAAIDQLASVASQPPEPGALTDETTDAARLATEQAETERVAAELAAAARLVGAQPEAQESEAQESEAQQSEAQESETKATEDQVWESLAGALGPDVLADQPVEPPATERPHLPPVPQVPPPPPSDVPWQMGAPSARMPGWAPPPLPGFRQPMAGWGGNGLSTGPVGHPGDGHLRSGIRPCPRCELALSANARFCRRCGLPQG